MSSYTIKYNTYMNSYTMKYNTSMKYKGFRIILMSQQFV